MPPSYEPSTSFTIRNEIGDLAVLRSGLNRFCTQHGVAGKTVRQLQVVLDEIVSNIIKYAWPEGGSHELSVRMSASTKNIQMEVVDDGQPFNPLNAQPPEQTSPARRRRPGGVGIHMTKQLVDDISYFRENGCNHIVLTKRCDGAGMRSREN